MCETCIYVRFCIANRGLPWEATSRDFHALDSYRERWGGWKRRTEHLGICCVCLLCSWLSRKWVRKYVCRGQHLHTSITDGGELPIRPLATYIPPPLVSVGHQHPLFITHTHLSLSMTFHFSPSVLWDNLSSLSLHRLVCVRTLSHSGQIHRHMHM